MKYFYECCIQLLINRKCARKWQRVLRNWNQLRRRVDQRRDNSMRGEDNGGCDAHSKQTLCSQISTELQHLRFPKPASTFTSNQLALYLHLWNLWMLLKSVFGFKQMSEMWVSGFVFQFAPRFHVFRHLYFHLAVWGHSNGNLRVNPNLLPSRWQGKKRKLWEVGEAAEI